MPDSEPSDTREFHRLQPRERTRLEAYRDPTGTGPDIAVRVLDLSPGGACLALSEHFAPGHLLGVALYGPNLFPIAGTARVAWCRESEDGTFLAGVAFESTAGEENVTSLARP